MTYYKIIQNNQIVDAGFVFLKWNERRHRFNLCDENEAQFVQAYDQSKVFRDEWLKPIYEADVKFESAQVVIIDKNEYDEIRFSLDGDEILPVLPDVQEEQVVIEHEKPAEETPMSISDMRRIIQEQQEQIQTLSQKLTEVSNAITK